MLLSLTVYSQSGDALVQRRQFQTIASKLDFGGDIFAVVNTEGLIDRMMSAAMDAESGLPANDPREKDVRQTLGKLRMFLLHNGFTAVHGAGISSLPLEEGRNAIKFFVSRDYIDSNLPLWRGLVGWLPRRLRSLDFIPADAAMVRAGTPQFDSLWKVLTAAVDEVAAPETRERFNRGVKRCEALLGLGPGMLLDSLGDEFMVCARISKTEQFAVPVAGGEATIPVLDFLVVVAVKNDILRGVVQSKFAELNIVLNEAVAGNVPMRVSSVTYEKPFPFQPAYASTGGYFVFGSSPEIVADALLAFRHKNGLVSRDDFKAAFRGLPMVNNGIIYISSEMGEILAHLRASEVEQKLAGLGRHPALQRIVRQALTFCGKPIEAAFVILNWKTGVMVMGNSSLGAQDIIAALPGGRHRRCRLQAAEGGKNKPSHHSLFRMLMKAGKGPAEKNGNQ